MLVAFRLFWLLIFVAGTHFRDGLAWPALAVAALLGWLGLRVWWLAAPVVILALAAGRIYAQATSEGKISGALGNIAFELVVFAVLSLAGYLLGRYLSWRGPSPPPSPRSRGEGADPRRR